MKVTTNVVDELETAKELLDVLQRIERVAEKVQIQFGFLTIKDVVKLTGISEPQVQRIFRRKDFPVCDYGKQKLVEIDAFKEYFQHPVLTTDDEDNG